jgi:hypothetical protein
MYDLFPTIVYLLCFATSAACAWLLIRSYLRGRAPLLLWSGLCFLCLAANNLVVVLDLLVLPAWDMRLVRHLLALAGITTLLYGFVWKMEDE